ncbi:hypothetical protein CTEN210_18122 [Chaetoceros tenuissimus]|uniref:Protein-S-isoprenylcysteine O-methyltransferase n=1 Tax=Chaetoceros tenuissimus TaxID=426638 RepID=A0AAD3DC62_9STRA|nr:hypothetical protein CTEN210_18122 [Chaetoceros tenuissimus]
MKLQVFLHLSVPVAVNCFSSGNFVGTRRTSSSLIRPSSSSAASRATTRSRLAIDFTALFEQSKETELTKSESNTKNELEISDTVQKVITNISSGELGSRGEIYFAIQAVLFLCILYGNIPVLGDVLTFLFGPVACLAGVAVAALGLKDLGSNLSPFPKVPENTELVQTGIFAEIRHPIYAGLLCFSLGLSIWTGSAMRMLLTGALWLLLEKKSDYEEASLVETFDGYSEYKNKVTGKFFPARLLESLPFNVKEISSTVETKAQTTGVQDANVESCDKSTSNKAESNETDEESVKGVFAGYRVTEEEKDRLKDAAPDEKEDDDKNDSLKP